MGGGNGNVCWHPYVPTHSPYVNSCLGSTFGSTSLRPSGLAVSALARLGPHIFLDENGKKNR